MDKHKKEAIKKLRKDIEYKVSAEKQAFEMIVELVSEDFVNEERLIKCFTLLNPRNYSDIIEERFSMKLCGYILCVNKLENIPKHKYHISVKTKQVFELSERKKFCCDSCYKASEFFASQLSNEPLWERKYLPKTDIKFLKIESSSEKPQNVEEQETFSVEDGQKSDISIKVHEKNREISENSSVKKLTQDFSKLFDSPATKPDPIIPLPPLEECCKVVSNWLTNRTLNFLIKNTHANDFFDGLPMFPKLTEQLREQIALKMNKAQSDSDDVSSEDSDFGSDLDDFTRCNYLSNSAIDKLQAVYTKHAKTPTSPTGKLPSIHSIDSENIPKIEEKDLNESELVFPPVDTFSQVNTRSRIVLEKLNKASNFVTKSLRLMPGEFWGDLTYLVKTFRLSQYNISFKPNQWVFILIILMYFISLMNLKVKASLEDERNLAEFNTPLIEQAEDPTLLKTIAVIHP